MTKKLFTVVGCFLIHDQPKKSKSERTFLNLPKQIWNMLTLGLNVNIPTLVSSKQYTYVAEKRKYDENMLNFCGEIKLPVIDLRSVGSCIHQKNK